jgi:ADP-ribosyl-[dinitrogen reductase] hydrolase
MIGVIIGDIVGSRWEFRRIKTKEFPLFSDRNGITDDSILTVAVLTGC